MAVPFKIAPIADRIKPQDIIVFPGSLENKKLNFFERKAIEKVKAPTGDYRNWKDIKSWAVKMGSTLKESGTFNEVPT